MPRHRSVDATGALVAIVTDISHSWATFLIRNVACVRWGGVADRMPWGGSVGYGDAECGARFQRAKSLYAMQAGSDFVSV